MPLSVNVEGRWPVFGDRGAELVDDDPAGDRLVCGESERVAGVIIEPGEDLGVGPVGEWVVHEVRLPTLVRLFGFEPDVGAAGPFLRFGGDEPRARQRARDGRDRHGDAVVVFEMPVDRVGSGVETVGDECASQFDDAVKRWWTGSRSVWSSGDVTWVRTRRHPRCGSGRRAC
jgi:hypothetical protein